MSLENDNNSVVYSFQSRWEEHLNSKSISVFFRKRAPKLRPETIYIYVGSPVKKIIGRAKVTKILQEDLRSSMEKKSLAKISADELTSYIGRSGKVYSIEISEVEIFKDPPNLKMLNEAFGFNPPQSFCGMRPEMERYLQECKK